MIPLWILIQLLRLDLEYIYSPFLTMSAATIIEEAFGPEANLYTTVLKLPESNDYSSIPAAKLRKAYYRQALKYHPDKQSEKTSEEIKDAKQKFQAISVAYSILSDEERRKLYDETGEMDDNDDMVDQTNTDAWKDYFKGIFGKVTTADIDRFTESYKCSDEEEKDVLKYYKQFRGDLNKMLECVMCSDDVDKKRWVQDYIKPAIEKGDVDDYMSKVESTLGVVESDESSEQSDKDGDETETEEEEDSDSGKKKGKKRKTKTTQKKPAKKKNKKKDAGVSDDLIAAIRGRASGGGQGFGGILAGLEERYAPKNSKKKGKKKKTEDIPDDEFEKIQKRLDAQRKSRK